MAYILNKRVVKHLIKEERDTKKRYVALGKRYNLPKLVKAGIQEGQHSNLFKGLTKRRFTATPKRKVSDWRAVAREDSAQWKNW